MTLGLCCQFLEPRTKRDKSVVWENSINEKSLQLGRFQSNCYSSDLVIQTYHNNINEIIRLIPKLISGNINCFRLSSGLLPLFDLNSELAKTNNELLRLLAIAGKMFRDASIRVTCHPGQFIVLSSDSEKVISNSIDELNYHAWIFDRMGFERSPFYAINIHGGKSDRSKTLIKSIESLGESVRSRLTLENDESCYSVRQLLEVSKETQIPVVFDSHHFIFNQDGMTMEEASQISFGTWGNVKPLQHISNTIPGQENGNFKERRKHSDFIHYVPKCQLDAILADTIDLEIEAKMKNLALNDFTKKFIENN